MTIGVVCSGSIAAHRDTVKEHLERGIAEHPEAEWVCLEKKSDAMTRDLLLQLGLDPTILTLDPRWKIVGPNGEPGCDVRRVMRDSDMLQRCDTVVVFTKPETKSWWREQANRRPWEKSTHRIHEHLHLVELGSAKKKK